MGIEDRDWWRERHNPRTRAGSDARPARTGAADRRRTRSGGAGRWLLLIAALIGLGYVVGKGGAQLRDALAGRDVRLAIAPPRAGSCSDTFPAAGTRVDKRAVPPASAGQSLTTFVNQTAVDRVVDLLDGEKLLLSIAVPAGAHASVDLPEGSYGWRLRNGAAWCAQDWRFVREQRTVISPPLEIVRTSQLSVDIAPDGSRPTGFALNTRDEPVVTQAAAPPTVATSVDGALLLPRAPDGHYYVDGTVDQQPVRFLVDTGASRVAVPVALARQLGYYQGREVTVKTANGETTGSEFKVARISFGPFVAEDVTVVALWNLETPLLGMSLLRTLDLRQTPEGLQLRRVR